MKNKRKIRTWLIISLLIIVCLVLFFICVKDLYSTLKKKSVGEVKILETIEKYDYKLNENDSNYTKELFRELKKELEKEKVDEEKYATLISQIFISDFYSLKNTINKNDVGGTEFIYKDYQADFVKGAKNTIYKYVENNIYNDRKQELPSVKSVEIDSIKNIKYKYFKELDEKAYEIITNITYEKDLNYPTKVTLYLIHSNNKLEIAEMKN